MSIHMATDGAPFPSVEDDLRRQIMGLRASLASAEAEVARLKALLEAKQPHKPDVVVPQAGQVWGWAAPQQPDCEWVLVCEAGGQFKDWHCYSPTDKRIGTISLDQQRFRPGRGLVTYRREATPAERAAAGLPAEAPAKPEVLPEHLAFLDAMAAERTEESHIERPYAVYRTTTAARALLAAVARRDGGAK